MLAAAAAAAVLVLAAPAEGAVTGVSDAGTGFFDSEHYRALALDTVRLVVPWDAGLRPGPWDDWLRRATREGADIMVAFGHAVPSNCPLQPCRLPGGEEYQASVRALVGRHPAIRHVVPWNEPNHSSQPTAGAPEAAAGYVRAAARACPSCTIVAGNLLDDASMPRYLARYRAALDISPDVWGVHSYWDATYFMRQGIEHVLATVTGPVWITETGGLVAFGTLPYDEGRAAASLRWMYGRADAHPRIGRMYVHQWQSDPGNPFDSGLLGASGRPRPSYEVVAGRVGPRRPGPATGQPEPGPPGAADGRGPSSRATAPATSLRVAGKALRMRRDRRLALALSCAAAPADRCRGVVDVRVGQGARTRVRVALRAGRSTRRSVRLPRTGVVSLARAQTPRVEVRVCHATTARCDRARVWRVTVPRAVRRWVGRQSRASS